MRLNIYCIHDSCAAIYQRPFFAQSDGEAMRSFGDIASDTEHPIGKHPEHYSIWRLGTYSQDKAEITLESRECLGQAIDLVTPENVTSISPGGTI